MTHFVNITLIVCIALALGLSAPVAHSHTTEKNHHSINTIQAIKNTCEDPHAVVDHHHESGHVDGDKIHHNGCSHHSHSGPALLSGEITTLLKPDRQRPFYQLTNHHITFPVYRIDHPPRLGVQG